MARVGDLVGPFQLEEQLGIGGMGVVFRARYVKNDQKVALKLLSEAGAEDEVLAARFDRELAVLKKLKHKHIVHCYGGGRHCGQQFIAMEIISGGSLATVLRRKGKLSWEETLRIGKQVCDALSHAHDAGIIHRDLKPANLLLTASGDVKLSDFGLARDQDASRLTRTGKTMGTFSYMSPEQIRGTPPMSHKTDLYALGCVLFEMLAGRPPFVADDSTQILYKQLEETPPKVRQFAMDCPVWLEGIIAQLLEKHPDKRPLDALAVLQSLHEVEDKVARGESVAAHMASGSPTTLQKSQESMDVKGLLGRKRKKKKKRNQPLFERTWFLVSCLVVMAGLVTWGLWPMSEMQLWERGSQLMASEHESDWIKARDSYFKPYIEKYPQGQFAEQVQRFLDKLEMDRAEKLLEYHARLGRDPTSESERLYVEARKYELFGDMVSSLEKYDGMVQLLKDDTQSRPFVNLARRQSARIRDEGGQSTDRRQLVEASLHRADELYQKQGNVLEARKIWDSIIKLYSGNRELTPLVKRAIAKLADPDADGDSTVSADGATEQQSPKR